MNRRQFILLASSGAIATCVRATGMRLSGHGARPTPPVTAKVPRRIDQLGRCRVDEYAWLKPANWKAVWKDPSKLGPRIRAHLEAEDAYARKVLAPTSGLQKQLFDEMQARSVDSHAPPPWQTGNWLYSRRTASGAQHASWYRQRRDTGDSEQCILDGPARAHGKSSFTIKHVVSSPDQKLLAWAESATGSEWYRILVKDLATGKVLSHPIENAYGEFVFSPDSEWIFWVCRSRHSRPSKIYRRHARGHADTLVYHEVDPDFLMTLQTAASGRYIMIRCWNADTSEVRLIPAQHPTRKPRVVEPRTAGLIYSVEAWKGFLVILTNADGAANYKVMRTPENTPGRRHWQEWIRYDPRVFITGMLPFRDHFVRIERKDVNPHIVIRSGDNDSEQTIRRPDPIYSLELCPHQRFDSATLRYAFQSPKQPRTWVALDLSRGKPQTLKSEQAGADFAIHDYVTERIHARAEDGAQVPIMLLYRKDTRLDGSAPLLMQAYGAYGAFIQPEFSASRLSLIDRGWIYAFAYVRGGSAKGRTWYTQARRLHKKRSFTDFIACAEATIARRYTRRGRIVMYGFSAGGLIAGAVLNMRPGLFSGVIGEAPFVDMLNTMSDPSHPLVPLTYPDWGNPLASRSVYDYMASYSPYDNVKKQACPPVLATTSIADNRVGFWEPAKWIAKLRDDDTSATPKLLRLEQGGHGGASGHLAKLRQKALFYAFCIWATAHVRD